MGPTPRFPRYVVSYSRPQSCLTADALDHMGLDYTLVIEPEEYDAYAAEFDTDRLLTVPERFHDAYDTYDDLGREKSQGPGPARNFAWHHATEQGHDWHWVMDDNIEHFYRYHDNRFRPFGDGTPFRAIEDFVLQYENIAMAGPRYFMFIVRKKKHPPLTFNTRVYSCNLIRNDVDFEWAGRYNEDTDLSLRMLKRGWCTVLFNTFLQGKVNTQRLDGGNTKNFYKEEGTYPKSKMLKDQHPLVTDITRKWGRWHHEVDYEPFKGNQLQPKADPDVTIGDYDLELVESESARTAGSDTAE